MGLGPSGLVGACFFLLRAFFLCFSLREDEDDEEDEDNEEEDDELSELDDLLFLLFL